MPVFIRWIAALMAAFWLPLVFAYLLGLLADHFRLDQKFIPYLEILAMGLGSSTAALAIINRPVWKNSSVIVSIASFVGLTQVVVAAQLGRETLSLIIIAFLAAFIPFYICMSAYEKRSKSNATLFEPAQNFEQTQSNEISSNPLWSYYFHGSSRVGRGEFWINFRVPILIFCAAFLLLTRKFLSYTGPLVVYYAMIYLPICGLIIWLWVSGLSRRYHDLNKSRWWIFIWWPPLFIFSLYAASLNYFKISDDLEMAVFGIISIILLVSTAGLMLWQFIELGFFSGTPEQNRFGPYPLQKGQKGWWAWRGLASIIGIPLFLYLPFTSISLIHDATAQLHFNQGATQSALRTGTISGTPAKTVSILFIGNSYTAANDLPGMLLQVASSDPANAALLEVQSLTSGGATLHDFVASGSAQKTISSRHWDYVVLQEQSDWAMRPEGIESTNEAAPILAQAIRDAGAKPVLFVTWARKPGSPSYPEEAGMHFQDPVFMQRNLDDQSTALVQKIGADTIMAGDSWAAAEGQDSNLDLYSDDSHPSAAGTYLTALLFFRYFTGEEPKLASFIPAGVTLEQGGELRAIAGQ